MMYDAVQYDGPWVLRPFYRWGHSVAITWVAGWTERWRRQGPLGLVADGTWRGTWTSKFWTLEVDHQVMGGRGVQVCKCSVQIRGQVTPSSHSLRPSPSTTPFPVTSVFYLLTSLTVFVLPCWLADWQGAHRCLRRPHGLRV